jgi:DNA-binding CsgD family transcriptional regulator
MPLNDHAPIRQEMTMARGWSRNRPRSILRSGEGSSTSRHATIRTDRFDVLRVLEATYDLEGARDEWLAGVLESFLPVLDGGQGAVAYEYRFGESGLSLSSFVGRGAPPGWELGAQAAASSGDPRVMALYRNGGGCRTVVEYIGRELWELPVYKMNVEPLGLVDFIGLNAADPEGRGILFGAAHGRELRIDPSTRTLLERVMTHVAAANRVRLRLDEGELDGDEAICELSGEVVHAEEPAKSREARAALRSAIVAIDRVRRRVRKSDPDDVLGKWRALVRERWTLVDRFERDGRHYMVAKRNEPRVTEPAALSRAERHVAACAVLGHSNKLIAYELGETEAAVATRLSRAAKKLGVKSRVELVQLLLSLLTTPRES